MMKLPLALLVLCGLCLLASPAMAARSLKQSACAFGYKRFVRPGPLVGVRVTAHNPTWLALEWKDPANGACYRLVEVEVSGPGFPTQHLQVASHQVTIRGLKPGIMYNVKLTPITLSGSGDSVLIRFSTGANNGQYNNGQYNRAGCRPDNYATPEAVNNLQAVVADHNYRNKAKYVACLFCVNTLCALTHAHARTVARAVACGCLPYLPHPHL